jgi:predicted N-acetyltransferase YhbS
MPTSTTLRLAIRTAAEVTAPERRDLAAFWDHAFPPPAGQVRPPDFAEPATVMLILRDSAGALIGACRLRDRTIAVDGAAARVAGLASVAVAAAHRGRGHGSWLVQLATDTARARGYAWSVLFCPPARQGFYHRLGWRALAGELRVGPPEAAEPIDPTDSAVLALPLTRAAAAHLPAWRTARIVLPDSW